MAERTALQAGLDLRLVHSSFPGSRIPVGFHDHDPNGRAAEHRGNHDVLVTVASFTEPWEAHLFRLRLQAEGIPAVIAHEHHVWANWPQAIALGGVKVQVPRSDSEKALAIERQCHAGEYQAALEAEVGPIDDPRCPRCGSARLRSRRTITGFLLAAAALYAGATLPVRATLHSCKGCGLKWRDRALSPRG